MKRNESSECVICNGFLKEPFAIVAVVHNIQLGGVFHRLCTACVLKAHPGSFCPVCFEVYNELNPLGPQERVRCLTCPSVSHSSCVGPGPAHAYRCPPCSKPNFSFFNMSQSNKRNTNYDDVRGDCGSRDVLTLDLAKQFLAAAKIASISMNEAVELVRAHAEQSAKEAILAKQRAKEALDQLSALTPENDIPIQSAEN